VSLPYPESRTADFAVLWPSGGGNDNMAAFTRSIIVSSDSGDEPPLTKEPAERCTAVFFRSDRNGLCLLSARSARPNKSSNASVLRVSARLTIQNTSQRSPYRAERWCRHLQHRTENSLCGPGGIDLFYGRQRCSPRSIPENVASVASCG